MQELRQKGRHYLMKGTINGLMYSGLTKTTIVEIALEGNQAAEIEKYKGKHIDMTLKQYRKARSLDANAYYWVLLDRLATVVNVPKTEIYRMHVRDIGGNCEMFTVKNFAVERLCNGWSRNGMGWITDTMPSRYDGYTNVFLYYGSSTYDTHQMSRLIDLAVQDCQAQGIETKTPAEIENMLSLWETAKGA